MVDSSWISFSTFLNFLFHELLPSALFLKKSQNCNVANFWILSKWKSKTQVTSYGLRVQTHWLRVQIHELRVFLFHLKSSFRSQDIWVFALTFWSCIEKTWLKTLINFKFYDVTAWLTSNCNTHIAQYFEMPDFVSHVCLQ